ncbi:unnamed protein product [Eruca vesicaria subsp. sativa]|uniref:Uncharacterized protein n=1 Tax=Eruca vesicaria subsp. sativa TaxID=29727 RepID=A0ABC8L377_ERUVS|nr:unnamed protein product [Eruca vesicaria subsp. sativa]
MDEDHSASDANRASGSKRSFAGVKDDESDISFSKKVSSIDKRLEDCKDEVASLPAFFAAAIEKSKEELVSLVLGSIQSYKDHLASSQNELESEIDKWKSAFKDESFVPARKSPEPQHVIDYIQTLRSSDKSLREELEIAKMKLAIHDLKSQLKTESVKPTNRGTEVHSEQQQQGTTPSGSSRSVAWLEEELRAANARIAELNEYQEVELKSLVKVNEYNRNMVKVILEKLPDLFPPPPAPAPKDDNEQM